MISQATLKDHLWYDPVVGLFLRKKSYNEKHAGRFVTTKDNDGYIQINIEGKKYRAHRLAWLYMYGKFPEGQLDHKNRIRWDNSIGNLRECSFSQNHANKPCMKNSKTGIKGVQMTPAGRYRARVKVNGKKINLGVYDDAEKAHAIYMEKLKEVHGEFASS